MKNKKCLTAFLCAIGFFGLAIASCDAKNATLSGENSSQEETFYESSYEPSYESSSEDSSGSFETSSSSSSSSSSQISSSSSQTSSSTPAPAEEKTQYVRCTGSNVNIRAGAGTDFAILGSAEKDTVYAVIGKIGNWYKTYYKGKTAYIYASYVSVFSLKKSENKKAEAVLSEGYKLIGVPYVYGAVRLHDGKGNLLKGFSAQAFDCSSLVQYVFYKGASKNLQTTTRTQVTQGKYVSKANLQRGDCIYFTNEERQYKTGIERVGHVAIYLGNNYILHTASDYARIEKLSDKRWSFYVEARRFF